MLADVKTDPEGCWLSVIISIILLSLSGHPLSRGLKMGMSHHESSAGDGTQICAGFLEDVVSGRCAACVTAARCDTACADEAAAILGAGARRVGVPPITGIINSGGVLADAILSSQTAGACNPRNPKMNSARS